MGWGKSKVQKNNYRFPTVQFFTSHIFIKKVKNQLKKHKIS